MIFLHLMRINSAGKAFIKKTGRGLVLFFHPRYVLPVYVYWFFHVAFWVLYQCEELSPHVYVPAIIGWTNYFFLPICAILCIVFFVKRKFSLGFVYMGHMFLVLVFALPVLVHGYYLFFIVFLSGFSSFLSFIGLM